MSSQTPSLLLTKPDRGAPWYAQWNANADKIDTAVGGLNSTIDDLPQIYRYADIFNGPTGTVVALPKSVIAVNEYAVKVTPITRTASIGDIYVTKAVDQVTVHCAASNTTDMFEVAIYYLGDVNSYGGAIYRRYYVSPSTSITDHANAATAGSIANIVATIGSTPAVMVLPGNRVYTIDSDIDLSAKPNLYILPDPGAELARTTGDEVFTVYSPFNLLAAANQKLTSADMIEFAEPGVVYSGWFYGDLQYAVNALPATGGGRIFMAADGYDLGTSGLVIAKSGIILEALGNSFVSGSRLTYSGTGVAVTVGANGQTTYNVVIRDINIQATGSAISGSNAMGIKVINAHYANLDRVSIEDFQAGRGIWWTADANPRYGATSAMNYCQVHDCLVCVDLTGTDGWAKMNHLRVIGGFYSSMGRTFAGSICFDVDVYSDSTILDGVDVSNAETGVKVDGANCRLMAPRFEEVGTCIDITATGYWTTIVGAQFSNVTTEISDGGFETLNLDFNATRDNGYSNAVPNGSFERWSAGSAAAPDGYSLGGTGSVARESTYLVTGRYSAKLTNTSGQTSTLYIDLSSQLNRFRGKWIRASILARTTTGNNARLRIDSDAATGGMTPSNPGYSDYHSGAGAWELITVYTFIGAAATTLTIYILANAALSTAYFDDLMVCEGKRPINYLPQIEERLEETLYVDQDVAETALYLSKLDSSAGNVTFYLGNGSFIGQQKRFVLIDATNTATLYVSTHETSSPEVFTFSAVGDYLILEWTGTSWVTIKLSGATV